MVDVYKRQAYAPCKHTNSFGSIWAHYAPKSCLLYTSEMKILFGHILPNAVLPLITILGVVMGWLLGGVAVVEMVFSWPGLGNMAVYAITMRDYPLIEGFVLWVALAYMCINALIDASYVLLDPRLKRERA